MATFNLLRASYTGSLGNTTGQTLRGRPILKAKIEFNHSKTEMQTAQRTAYAIAKEAWYDIGKPLYAFFQNPNCKKWTPYNDFMHSATSYMRDPSHSLTSLHTQINGTPILTVTGIAPFTVTPPTGFKVTLAALKSWEYIGTLDLVAIQYRPSDKKTVVGVVTPTATQPYFSLDAAFVTGDEVYISLIGVDRYRRPTQSAEIYAVLPTAAPGN